MSLPLRTISQQELSQHSKRGDCWVVIHGHVFDVSRFMEDHPGGSDMISKHAKQQTDAGDEFEASMHGKESRAMALQFLIGKTEAGSSGKPFPMQPAGVSLKGGGSSKGGDDSSLGAVLAGAVVALGAYYIYQQQKMKRG